MDCQIKQILWFTRIFIWKCIIGTSMLGFVLSLSSCSSLKSRNYGDVIAEDEFFIQYSIGVVVDKRTDMMWAQADNGGKLSIEEA
ncbi:MAG: hypothetical protein GY710_11295, partial [Desulfobacteraceae bacterium]|nr:hypothetical protein [Desulfobacteraceae bacterium]